jgi:hypothetical protein
MLQPIPVFTSLFLALTLTTPAAAEPFAYLVGDLANTNVSTIVQTDTLFLVDLATGEAVTIGQVQSVDCAGAGGVCGVVGGISIDPFTGILFAVSDIGNLLITIDPDTAQATVIDELTLGGTSIPDGGFGLTHDAGATLYFASTSGRRLAVVDTTTAFLSNIAIASTGAPQTQAIADADATHLWAIRRLLGAGNYDLISIRKVTPGDPIPMDFITSIGGISPAPGGDDLGLDLAPDGTLWGVGPGPSVGGGHLFQLDKTTAAMTGVTEITVPATGQIVVNPASLSILTTQAVPGLNPLLLVALSTILACVAAWSFRRAQRLMT